MSASSAFERSYPADLRDGPGIRLEKSGLRVRASLDCGNFVPLAAGTARRLIAVHDPESGAFGALDLASLPMSEPAYGTITNAKLVPAAPERLFDWLIPPTPSS